MIIKINVTAPRMKTNINMAIACFIHQSQLISYSFPLPCTSATLAFFQGFEYLCSYDKVYTYCSLCLNHSYESSSIYMKNSYLSFMLQLSVMSSENVTSPTSLIRSYPLLIYPHSTIYLSFRVFIIVSFLKILFLYAYMACLLD